MRPFFSIIVPVYNAMRFLRQCLDSVLSQSIDDWECICVDDGSTDGSSDVLDEYAKKVVGGQCRIRVIHQTNAGVSVARNAALDVARGQWITFLDADDYWDTNLLSTIDEVVKCHRPDMVRCNFTRLIGDKCNQNVFYADEKVIESKCVQSWSLDTFPKRGYAWLCFMRHDVIRDCRFPVDIKYAEDALFLLRCATCMRKIVQICYAGYFYRDTPDSAMKRAFGSQERLRFLTEFKDVCLLYGMEHPNLSWMAWFNLVNWICKPSDVEHAADIHKVFSQLAERGFIRINHLLCYARIPCWLYHHFGWRMPTRATYYLISCAVRLRDHHLKRDLGR